MWRATALPVKIWILDARACLPAVLAMAYWSWTTFYMAVAGIVVFSVISFFGMTLPAVMRASRRFIIGSVRAGVPVWKRRYLA